jgi:hypothetical protein
LVEVDEHAGRSRDRGVVFTVGRVELQPARLIYGTIILVALLGLLAKDAETTSEEALALILGASLALYLSHCYSEAIGARFDLGRPLNRVEKAHIVTQELSVVALAVVPVALLLCARFGLLETDTALRVCMWGGIGLLGLAGWALGEGGRLPVVGRFLSAVLSAALGTGIVLLELLFAH